MRVKDLAKELSALDPEAEVVVRVSMPEGAEDEYTSVDDVIGEYCGLTDERNVSVESERVVLVGDLPGI